MNNFKKEEIKEHFKTSLNEINKYEGFSKIKELIKDNELHNRIFNEDYYLIGYYNCEKWLENRVFDVIECVQEWEEMNFGEAYTKVSNSEKLVNMYVYIIGEEIVSDYRNQLEEEGVINSIRI